MTDYDKKTSGYFFRSLVYPLGVLLVVMAPILLFNCNREPGEKNGNGNTLSRGESLMIEHKCFTCHQKNAPSTGPSFRQLSEKYTPDQQQKLVNAVSQGSTGSWGPILMPPHPEISIFEIDSIVTWILAGKF